MAVEGVVVAEVVVGASVVVGTETEEIGMEVVEVTDTEVVEDTTETGMEVDMAGEVAEVLIEEAMVVTGTDHTDLDKTPLWRKNYTATHSVLFLFSCNVNTTYRCV